MLLFWYVYDQDSFEADDAEVVFDFVVAPLVCDDDLVDLDADVVVKFGVGGVVVLLCLLLLYDVVMELVYQDDDDHVDVYFAVVGFVHSLCSDVNVLLDVRPDVVMHNDQLDIDDVLMLTLDAILIFDVLLMCPV